MAPPLPALNNAYTWLLFGVFNIKVFPRFTIFSAFITLKLFPLTTTEGNKTTYKRLISMHVGHKKCIQGIFSSTSNKLKCS